MYSMKAFYFVIYCVNSINGFSIAYKAFTCNGVQSNSAPVKHSEFYSFINKTEREITNTFNWIWPGLNKTGIWDVLYKEEEISGIKTGRNVFLNEINITLYFNWLYSDGKLSWTSTYHQIPEEKWNITLCNKNNHILFEGTPNKWTFTMGDVSVSSSAGSTGSIDVGKDFLTPLNKLKERIKRSPQSETEDDRSKETVWNRLKGYFKELFDRGPNDQRGWLTRLADWILGFLERLLT
ncbi:uncharacterized protein [Rhodnius prolixus]|uniref:uncharacterized protein n=1 Tax=Rhodnius prolixus TaxID=13249 RepID=UPI003D18A9B4